MYTLIVSKRSRFMSMRMRMALPGKNPGVWTSTSSTVTRLKLIWTLFERELPAASNTRANVAFNAKRQNKQKTLDKAIRYARKQ